MNQQESQLSAANRQQTLKRALKWALGIHLAVIVIAALGLPSWRRKEPFDMTQAVNVDLVAPTGDISAAPNKAKKPFVPNAKPQEKPKPTPPKANPEKPPTPVKSDAAKKEDVVKKPDEEQLEQPKEKVEKPKKLATEKAAEKPSLEKKPEKKKPVKDDGAGDKQKQEEFNSILKNLLGAPDDATPEGDKVDAPVDPTTKNSGTAPTTSETLQLSEMDALRYQLAKCWNIPSGAMNAEDLIVDIYIEVNPDRTVKSAEIMDQMRYNTDDFFRAAADSARRAVFNPMCTPLQLPPDKYDVWKEIRIRFNPKDMFGG